jgi:hypothetical protein
MFYDEAETIIINKRENEFCNDAVIFAEQIAGDDALNAALMQLHSAHILNVYDAALDVTHELVRIQSSYARNDIDEEVGILLTENGGKRDENGEWR